MALEQREFKPINFCIYCGSDGGSDGLRREHILPFFLGGSHVLPKASCRRCEGITRDFEQSCARHMFGRLRLLTHGPTRNKKQRPTELPLHIEIDGVGQTISVAINDYPATAVAFPVFEPPDIITLAPTGQKTIKGSVSFVMVPVPDNDARLRRLRDRVGKPFSLKIDGDTPIFPFAKLLAKIAHAGAIGEYGLGSFQPFLTDFIWVQTRMQAATLAVWPPRHGWSSLSFSMECTDLFSAP
mgnify:CR=1 FL=1